MWKRPIHTEKFILKIAGECGLTPREVKDQVNRFYGQNWLYYQVINFLACLTADDMRFIFRLNKFQKGENKMKVMDMWMWLLDNGIATDEELSLITGINGLTIETLNDVLYYRTGYRDREQLEGEEYV